MKLLLTSGGITNARIQRSLVELLGKPISACNALCIPTAEYGHPKCTPASAWRFVAGKSPSAMCDLGWKSVGLLELTALPTINAERWGRWVREADVFLVDGGDMGYLSHWLRHSGIAALFPSLPKAVWVGVSAGSMAMTPRIGKEFAHWKSPTGDDNPLGMVDFSIFPHLGHESMPDNNLANAQRWAANLGNPAYALDDQSAIRVVEGVVQVISEGHWKFFP